jgi:chitin synthase
MVDPFWDTKTGPIGKLSEDEITFWDDMIDTYLKPLKKDVKMEEEQKQGLIKLRNQMAFSMLMINGIWITGLFLMQIYKENLSIPWPVPGDEDLQLEPLGLIFIVMFAVVLVLQLIGNFTRTRKCLLNNSEGYSFLKSGIFIFS